MLSEVPAGWSFTAFDEAAKLQSGFPFKSASFSDDKTVGYPLIRIRDLLKQDPSKFVNEEVLPEFIISKGDVLIGMDGEFNCVEWQTRDAALNQRVLKVMETNLSHRKFLLYLLQPLLTELEKSISGTTVKHLSTRDLRRLDLLLPPLPEQKRIAEILSSVDESIQATQSVIDQAERVKRGLMEDLLTGGLGSEAIARGEVPEGWRMIPFADFCEIKAGFGFPVKFQGRTEGDFPFYKVSDMNSSGNEQFMSVANHYVTEADLPVLKAKPYPAGAVIFPKIGAAIRTNKKRRLTKDSLIDNNVMALIANDNVVTPGYLFRIMERTNIYSFSSQNGLPSINKSTIAKAEALIPPLCEQKRIAEILSSVDEFIQSQKQIIGQYQVTKKGLMDDLLTGKVRTV